MTDHVEDAPDVSWMCMVPIREDRPRGVVLPPTKAHGRFPPKGDGLEEGSTWDCPECGSILELRVPRTGGMVWRPITFMWVPASWRTARRHRRRVARGEGER